MAYFVTTALGREVPLENREAIVGDAVLKVLHDYARSPFNVGSKPLSVRPLAHSIGLPEAAVKTALGALMKHQLVAEAGPGRWRITETGVAFVFRARGELSLTGGYG